MVAIPKQAGDTLIDTTTSLGQGFTKSLRKQSVDATGGSLEQVSLIDSAFSSSHHFIILKYFNHYLDITYSEAVNCNFSQRIFVASVEL